MRAGVFFFLLLSFSLACPGQQAILSAEEFSRQWKADTLGKSGFREQALLGDTVRHKDLLNGVNIKGYSKKKVVKMLGAPDSYGEYVENSCLLGGFFSCWWELHKKREMICYKLCDASVPGHLSAKWLNITFSRWKRHILWFDMEQLNCTVPGKN
jgi:hypothetical protein